MAQRRGRNHRARLEGVGRAEDRRGGRIDPILDELLTDGWEDAPGALKALMVIEDMRSWGVDVTPEIARKCLLAHMLQDSQHANYRAEQEQLILARRHPPIVYYMRLGSLVKIGFTTNLTKRLEVIHPEEVMVTVPGGRERENERHQQFATLHVHGEWFRLEAPLADHIEAVRREAAGE